ncbi:MAG: transcriptional regulator YeiL [Anaerolineaceae bacterium]|nr:transcriptional regulator YeiL [Clostridia bacterium]MBQ6480548.1 transcriptional regulator YeiL [Anaerolineaceae bacterium]
MKEIKKQSLIQSYLDKSGFLNLFSFDVRPYIRLVEYSKNEHVINSDHLLTRLFYLIEGTAKLYGIHKNGKQSLIDFVVPPCVLGETELFNEGKHPSPLVALTPCVFIELDLLRCRALLLEDVVFLRSLCNMMLKRRVAQNQKYIKLAAYPTRNNLATCLLLLENDGLFSEKYTEIADYLSISYRHLMHQIATMCDEGILERRNEGLYLLDREQLETLAGELID